MYLQLATILIWSLVRSESHQFWIPTFYESKGKGENIHSFNVLRWDLDAWDYCAVYFFRRVLRNSFGWLKRSVPHLRFWAFFCCFFQHQILGPKRSRWRGKHLRSPGLQRAVQDPDFWANLFPRLKKHIINWDAFFEVFFFFFFFPSVLRADPLGRCRCQLIFSFQLSDGTTSRWS